MSSARQPSCTGHKAGLPSCIGDKCSHCQTCGNHSFAAYDRRCLYCHPSEQTVEVKIAKPRAAYKPRKRAIAPDPTKAYMEAMGRKND